jgi:uncharacterized protein (DUF1015 family)
MMADIRAFKGLSYGPDLDLDMVAAPPYDVISAAQATELRTRSPYNAVHVDLPVAPGEAPAPAAYAAAAETLKAWRTGGVLRSSTEPALYLVDETYRGPDGRERTRRGFVARLLLAGYDERVVLPHERTHATAKADRLELYRAAHADLSTVFLLYPDDDGMVSEALSAAADEVMGAAREARDGDGNVHRVAPLSGARADRIASLLRSRRLYIADGHHRYETALAYRDERRVAGDHSADTMMVYLCGMNDPGLAVFPTHRLIKGVEVPPLAELLGRLDPCFEPLGAPCSGREACAAAFEGMAGGAEAGDGAVFGLFSPADDAGVVVRVRGTAGPERLVAQGFSPAAAGLSVTILHELILTEALGMDPREAEAHIAYAKSVPEAMTALGGGGYGLGAFLTATRVDEVRAIADAGETMPQKSTYFYPKLLTGLVFDALEE